MTDKQLTVSPDSMLAMAVQQGADIDKLEKLMSLKERYDAAEAVRAFNAATARFREECPFIKKTKAGHNSKYAGLAETVEEIKAVMSRNGLSHSWRTAQADGIVSVTCCVTHSAGHSECTTLAAAPDTSGSKNSIQALGSTVSYLERYTLFAILGISSADMDDDGEKAAKRTVEFTPYQYQKMVSLLESGAALDFIFYQAEVGRDVWESIHSSFPDGRKSALKANAKALDHEGRAALLEVKESILAAIHGQDSFALQEQTEEMGIVGKMIIWAELSKEDRQAAKLLLETLNG